VVAWPGGGGRLAWGGLGRARGTRGAGGIGWRLRPRRSRCGGCGRTHVLLPVSCLLRRADGVAVIWAALVAKAAGLGYRPIAVRLGRPASTVRDWLARFGMRADRVRRLFALLCGRDPGPPLAPACCVAGDAVEAAVAAAATWRGDRVAAVPVGEQVSAVSGGQLLAPGWPPELISTSSF